MISIGNVGRSRTNRTIALFGTCGLLLLTVIQLPGLADQWEELRSQVAHQSELEAGYSEPERTSKLQTQLADVKAELAKLETSMVDGSTLPNVQSELIELLRGSGCQLRKVAIQAGSSNSWEAEKPEIDELPMGPDKPPADLDPGAFLEDEETYSLDTEQISISLTGTLEQVSTFLNRLRERPWMLRVAQVSFAHTPDENGSLAVEATIAFLKLSKSVPEGELVNWREGSRASKVH